jgi:hypothetical protein
MIDSAKLLEISAEWGKEIREQSEAIVFEGFDSPNYDRSAYEEILEQYVEYEDKVPLLTTMVVIYGDIALAYLNVQDFKNAFIYACAYLELNENDDKRSRSAYDILSNISLASGNKVKGVEFYKLAHPQETLESSAVLQHLTKQMEEENEEEISVKVPQNLSDYEKPKTFFLLEDKEEFTIRSTMLTMNIQRDAAIKHLEEM